MPGMHAWRRMACEVHLQGASNTGARLRSTLSPPLHPAPRLLAALGCHSICGSTLMGSLHLDTAEQSMGTAWCYAAMYIARQ
mmetsp:Transcript_18523/g.39772  ORF Transcript_18523/g.39772 Transcript_18523/m.39772 type:complete len:82 (-) Transcript_18523:241-486(-)